MGRFDKDFNGDSYADVIVGAGGYNSADVTMTGEATSNWFGSSVA